MLMPQKNDCVALKAAINMMIIHNDAGRHPITREKRLGLHAGQMLQQIHPILTLARSMQRGEQTQRIKEDIGEI